MYFPYLRARQYELIALRELVSERSLGKIKPVLEPVRMGFNNLNLAHKVFEQFDFQAYLIVNPLQGEMAGNSDVFLDYISGVVSSRFLPAFHYADNYDYIKKSIDHFRLANCMLICLDNFSDEQSFRKLCENPAVDHIMLLEPNKYRNLDKFIKSLKKSYIRLDDLFERQQKNADYLNILAHKFTEEHLFYIEDGYQGFSDFTVLPREFVDGGSTPRAVVIHLTYVNQESENQIWIRHFTSDTNDSIVNVQGKFAEAAGKASVFCKSANLRNSAIDELLAYYDEHRYPGLGTVKKISIKNHLLVVSSYLK